MELPEIVAAGIYNSDIVAKNTIISKNRKTSMFEIELPIETGGITYMDSASRPIEPNMIICAKPGRTRHTKFPFKCYYVHMIVHGGILFDTLSCVPDYFETANAANYQRIFQELIKHYHTLALCKSDCVLGRTLTANEHDANHVHHFGGANNLWIAQAGN